MQVTEVRNTKHDSRVPSTFSADFFCVLDPAATHAMQPAPVRGVGVSIILLNKGDKKNAEHLREG